MTNMNSELYGALIEIGVSEEKARKPAEAISSTEPRFDALDRKIDALDHKVERKIDALDRKIDDVDAKVELLKWMIAFVLGLLVTIMSVGAGLMIKFLPLPH